MDDFLVKLDANLLVVVAIDVDNLAKHLAFPIKHILNHTHVAYLVCSISQ